MPKLVHAKLAMRYKEFNFRQLAVLIIIVERKSNKVSIRHIAEELGIPKASVCRAFDNICILGLGCRYREDPDKRDCFLMITDAGRKLLEELA